VVDPTIPMTAAAVKPMTLRRGERRCGRHMAAVDSNMARAMGPPASSRAVGAPAASAMI